MSMGDQHLEDWDDAALELEAAQLGFLWVKRAYGSSSAVSEIASLVERDAWHRAGAPLGTLSAAFEVVMASVSVNDYRLRVPGGPEGLARLVEVVRSSRWKRAHQLLESGLACKLTADVPEAKATLARLRQFCPLQGDDRPGLERFWSEVSATVLNCNLGDYDSALQCCLECDRIAQLTGAEELVHFVGMFTSFVFLLVGDVEGALAVTQHARALEVRLGVSGRVLAFNLVLAHIIAGQFKDAATLLRSDAVLLDRAFLSGNPTVRCLAALLAAREGRRDEARALLEGAILPADAQDMPSLAANRAWSRGRAWLDLGEPDRAAEEVRAFLAMCDPQSIRVSPMNQTQLLRVLGDALEARGDLRGSLDALKQSQAACFRWAAQSVRSRLMALSANGPTVVRGEQLQRRLDAVAQAAESAVTQDKSAAVPRFLAHLTHEMRNPLNGVIGMTSLLALSSLDEQQRRYLGIAQNAAQMLLALCNDVLDMAKIESGRFTLHPKPMSVVELLGEVLEIYQSGAWSRSVALKLTVDAMMPSQLELDRLRLQQVLMNLVSNASKFTRVGEIAIDARWQDLDSSDEGLLTVSVTDTGPGLTSEQMSRLFQEFSQVDEDGAERHGGTGLGLALCRSLIKLMRGQINVVSEPGKGSTFWVEIPARAFSGQRSGSAQRASEPGGGPAASHTATPSERFRRHTGVLRPLAAVAPTPWCHADRLPSQPASHSDSLR